MIVAKDDTLPTNAVNSSDFVTLLDWVAVNLPTAPKVVRKRNQTDPLTVVPDFIPGRADIIGFGYAGLKLAR